MQPKNGKANEDGIYSKNFFEKIGILRAFNVLMNYDIFTYIINN